MYNRYVPRPDGSYTRRKLAEPVNPQRHNGPVSPPRVDPPPPPYPPKEIRPSDFLRKLIPKDFDLGDLIVILLLLLMAGDSQEEKNNAILTIALYFLL